MKNQLVLSCKSFYTSQNSSYIAWIREQVILKNSISTTDLITSNLARVLMSRLIDKKREVLFADFTARNSKIVESVFEVLDKLFLSGYTFNEVLDEHSNLFIICKDYFDYLDKHNLYDDMRIKQLFLEHIKSGKYIEEILSQYDGLVIEDAEHASNIILNLATVFLKEGLEVRISGNAGLIFTAEELENCFDMILKLDKLKKEFDKNLKALILPIEKLIFDNQINIKSFNVKAEMYRYIKENENSATSNCLVENFSNATTFEMLELYDVPVLAVQRFRWQNFSELRTIYDICDFVRRELPFDSNGAGQKVGSYEKIISKYIDAENGMYRMIYDIALEILAERKVGISNKNFNIHSFNIHLGEICDVAFEAQQFCNKFKQFDNKRINVFTAIMIIEMMENNLSVVEQKADDSKFDLLTIEQLDIAKDCPYENVYVIGASSQNWGRYHKRTLFDMKEIAEKFDVSKLLIPSVSEDIAGLVHENIARRIVESGRTIHVLKAEVSDQGWKNYGELYKTFERIKNAQFT